MIERVPVDEAAAAEVPVAPADQLQLVLDGMVAAEPARPAHADVDARRPPRAPQLRRPRVDADVLVEPAARRRRLLAPELDRRPRRVPGEQRAPLAEHAVGAGVVGRQVVAARPEDDAAEGMAPDVPGD